MALVEVDLSRDLISKIEFELSNGDCFVQKVEYEKLSLYCFKCRQLGHVIGIHKEEVEQDREGITKPATVEEVDIVPPRPPNKRNNQRKADVGNDLDEPIDGEQTQQIYKKTVYKEHHVDKIKDLANLMALYR